MTISKLPSGKWRVRVKSGRDVVATASFELKRDAEAWEAKQKRLLLLGEFVDPKAGKELLGPVLDRWHAEREGKVASKTLNTERYAIKHFAPLRKRPLSAVKPTDLDALYGTMLRTLSRSTVVRFRQIASAFFSWCVDQSLIHVNPALKSAVPRGTGQDARQEIFPFTYAELKAVVAQAREESAVHADIILTLGLTGLRWGELSALRVRDVQELPYPALRVSRSKPDGQPVRTTTKGGKARTVPLTDEAAAAVLPHIRGKKPDDLVFPDAKGGYRANNNFKRAVGWKTLGRGRRIHDLRHTAATLWLGAGVDLKTVQAWLGHSSAKLTADTYAHFMGADADTAAVARLNAAFQGTPGGHG